MPGIASWGACIPRLRVARSTIAAAMGWLQQPGGAAVGGARSACNWDEDSLTLAAEAARDALPEADSRAGIGRVTLVTTTSPFADRSQAALLATALGLPEDARTSEDTGSQRAGTAALAQALAESAAPGARPALVVAGDRRLARAGSPQELAYGHGAAALVAGAEDGVAALLGARHRMADFVDHYRATGETFDYALEERWVHEAGWQALVPPVVHGLLREHGVDPANVAHFVAGGGADNARRLAAAVGLPAASVADALHEDCGDTGCGHVLLMLAGVLEHAQPGELILVAGFGQGVDALLFRTTADIARRRPPRGVAGCLAARRDETHYTRFLAHSGLLPVDSGIRAERDNRTAQTVLWRKHEEICAFTGGRCRACGAVQFPRARVCVNPGCRRTDTQEPHRLTESRGRVKTFTEDWLAHTPRPPLIYGNVSFEEGGNAFIEFADFESGEVSVGTPVRFVFRIKDFDRQRGFRRYFWKAAPGD
jgi:3-hydroxy-3-methylglutaryl CoA synthase